MDVTSFVKNNRLDIIIVLALFLLAFGIRTMPSEKFPNIYGFDSYWAARQTKYIITGEQPGWPFSPYHDTATVYPWGRMQRASELGWWGLNAAVYNIAGGTSEPFDYGLFGAVASWMVALTASLAIPAVYLFGKQAYDRIVGIGSALFLSGSLTHLSYSIFGHAENDGLGLSLFFLGLFSFVLTVKKRNWKYGLLTTFMFSWLAITWQSYAVAALLIAGTIIGYFAFYAVLSFMKFYKETEEKAEKRKWMMLGALFAAPSAIFEFVVTGSQGNGAAGLLPLIIAVIIAACIEIAINKEHLKNLTKIKEFWLPKILVLGALFLIIGFAMYGTGLLTRPLGFVGMDGGDSAEKMAYEIRMGETIAEQQSIGGDDFMKRLGVLSASGFGSAVWLAFFAVIGIFAKLFIMPFIRKDFNYEWDIMALGFILFSMWFLTEKAVTTFFLAGAIAFGAGYFFSICSQAIRFFAKSFENIKTYITVALFGVLILMAFSYNTITIEQSKAFGFDVSKEWFQTFDWIDENLEQGSVITAWWDYGHWLNYFNGDRIHTTLDNIQDRKDIIYTVASSFTHTPSCTQDPSTGMMNCDSDPEALEKAELESLSLLKPLETTHILIDKEIILDKSGALQHIADSSLGCTMGFGCEEAEDGNIICYKNVYFNELGQQRPVGFVLSKENWNALKLTPWPGNVVEMPAYLLDEGTQFTTVKTRWFAKDQDFGGKVLYGSSLACGEYFFGGYASATAPSVFSLKFRMFFNDPNLNHSKLVYDDGWNVIYEIDFTDVPDPEEYTQWTKGHSMLCTGTTKVKCELMDELL